MSADSYDNCPKCGDPDNEEDEDSQTFRQYHEFWHEDGRVIASFSGSCDKCKFVIAFRYDHKYKPPKKELTQPKYKIS